MNDLAIICVYKTGGDFCMCEVEEIYAAIQQHTTIPFDFYCLTDSDKEVHFTKIPLKHNFIGWWSKVELFRPNLVPNKRILYFDLDKFILKNIDDILVRDEPFVALRDFGRYASLRDHYFASAILSWVNDGRYNFIYNEFDYPTHTKRFRGDQDYFSYMMAKYGKTFTYWQDIVDGIFSYKIHILTGLVKKSAARIVCFHGKPRPNEVTF